MLSQGAQIIDFSFVLFREEKWGKEKNVRKYVWGRVYTSFGLSWLTCMGSPAQTHPQKVDSRNAVSAWNAPIYLKSGRSVCLLDIQERRDCTLECSWEWDKYSKFPIQQNSGSKRKDDLSKSHDKKLISISFHESGTHLDRKLIGQLETMIFFLFVVDQ